MRLDDVHREMLTLLRADGRLSMSALAEQVGISRANAYARLEAMQAAGVVRGFTVDVDPTLVGRPIAVLVFVSLQQNRWAEFREQLRELPHLEYFAVTTGQYDGMLLLRAAGVAEVHQLVVSVIADWPSVRSTETVFLMDEEHFTYDMRPSPAGPAPDDTLGMTRFVSTPDRRRAP